MENRIFSNCEMWYSLTYCGYEGLSEGILYILEQDA